MNLNYSRFIKYNIVYVYNRNYPINHLLLICMRWVGSQIKGQHPTLQTLSNLERKIDS